MGCLYLPCRSPIIGVFVFGDDLVHGGDGAFDHAVIRLNGGDMLKPYTGLRHDAGEKVILSACQLDQFIADADGHGKKSGLDQHTDEGAEVGGNEESDQHADENDEDDEGSTATGMEALLRTDVVNRERQTLFIAEDGLMLSAVVHKDTADILHARDKHHIENEKQDLENTFKGGLDESVEIGVLDIHAGESFEQGVR